MSYFREFSSEIFVNPDTYVDPFAIRLTPTRFVQAKPTLWQDPMIKATKNSITNKQDYLWILKYGIT